MGLADTPILSLSGMTVSVRADRLTPCIITWAESAADRTDFGIGSQPSD